MRLVSIYEYFKDKEGQRLSVGEDKEVLFSSVRYHGSEEELALYFKYKAYPIVIRVDKPQADLRLRLAKKITGLQKETFTPVEDLDSTLLTYLGTFAEEMEETVEYKLFDWRG